MKKIELIKCDDCGEFFTPGNRPDGLPNGIGFVLQDGTTRNICTDCIIKKGGATEGEKNEQIH